MSPSSPCAEGLLALLLPTRCAACARPASGPLCEACWASCRLPQGPTCVRCGAGWRPGGCGRCARFGRPFAFRSAAALFLYRGALRGLVHGFKYHGRSADLLALGRLMAESCRLAVFVQPGADQILVPVPLRRSSRRRRGYNQAEGLARGLAQVWKLPLETVALQRRREGAAQAGRGWRERIAQARAAFAGRPAFLRGRAVLLVDDVLSTGATADAAARAALRAGAVAVDVVALAG